MLEPDPARQVGCEAIMLGSTARISFPELTCIPIEACADYLVSVLLFLICKMGIAIVSMLWHGVALGIPKSGVTE